MNDHLDEISPERTPDTRRRTLLKAAGLLTLVGGGSAVLAACGGSATATSPTTSGAPGRPSVAESSVPEGGGVIMADADFVITQPSKGEFKAFSKICTHQGCPVSEITDTIDCMCHGSKFSITDGSVVNGPATQALAESKTTVTGGTVYVDS